MSVNEKLELLQQYRSIDGVNFCKAGVGFVFYMGDFPIKDVNEYHKECSVEKYYPTFEEALDAELEKIKYEIELDKMVSFNEITEQVKHQSLSYHKETSGCPIKYIEDNGLKNLIESFRPVYDYIFKNKDIEEKQLLDDVMKQFDGKFNPSYVMKTIKQIQGAINE